MMKTKHSSAFREQALRKVLDRGDRTVSEVADEIGMDMEQLKGWMRVSRRQSRLQSPSPVDLRGMPAAADRLELLLDSAQLSGEARQTFCRERGIYAHQLVTWKAAFANSSEPESLPPLRKECAALKVERDGLKRELNRKERALAEAAALLVLSKKYRALLADEVE